VLGSCNVLLGMFLWLKTLYRKRAVTWPFIFYTIIWTLSNLERFLFILSNITAVFQVFFNYLKSKVVKLNKKITLHSIFGLMVIAILNGKIISAIGMYGFAWIYLSIIILGYFFISKSLIKVLGINSYIVIISAISGQFVSFIKEKIFGTELIFSSNLTMFLHSTFRLALSVILTILMIKGIKK
ncbi:hypothetical protein, partial [Enterococcus faecalis]|uniref:hypothetical protein n=1 Tax=Enterococcus faecalis TaxID=1351 RepID=UPI003CCC5026